MARILRTAIFLLKDFNMLLVYSCQERFLSIVNPRHLHDDLNSINFSPYFKGTNGPMNLCLDNNKASDLVSWAISLLAPHQLSAVARGGAGGARAPPVFFLKSKNRPV